MLCETFFFISNKVSYCTAQTHTHTCTDWRYFPLLCGWPSDVTHAQQMQHERSLSTPPLVGSSPPYHYSLWIILRSFHHLPCYFYSNATMFSKSQLSRESDLLWCLRTVVVLLLCLVCVKPDWWNTTENRAASACLGVGICPMWKHADPSGSVHPDIMDFNNLHIYSWLIFIRIYGNPRTLNTFQPLNPRVATHSIK